MPKINVGDDGEVMVTRVGEMVWGSGREFLCNEILINRCLESIRWQIFLLSENVKNDLIRIFEKQLSCKYRILKQLIKMDLIFNDMFSFFCDSGLEVLQLYF